MRRGKGGEFEVVAEAMTPESAATAGELLRRLEGRELPSWLVGALERHPEVEQAVAGQNYEPEPQERDFAVRVLLPRHENGTVRALRVRQGV
ncbi:MAG: hypothetical protein HC901_02595 [Bdellovibrionaceae bacterium]|nr:hypothetical protein [Pseudobdellovibrionaceae bacterium]